ncbi:sulfite exporter TauE/SafE/copper chaperone CopZ [Anaerosolibacter carboniphilus]|uniref:Sulfite exporter TauE/SafE/copper chaperone CopZ n=1 Tax=Anaerosolibacter carboniphilus TaxID=1417629 RepID=A0A841KTS8_9FIRM|nr:sulfite exporter TauE/SafE family protein [Anaerosolibacter carboniphilus]MBB6215430.1 sulfite exporter TauE/SafE/copper chaperone CopZ [Anaerosolibacter carboniphilus]
MKNKVILYIDGMTCGSCERRIENSLSVLEGVEKVKASFHQSKVEIIYQGDKVSKRMFIAVVERLGYAVTDKPKTGLGNILPLLILLFGGYYIIQNTVGFNFIPEVSDEMGYGLLFVVGLLTSVHCVAMCGGIALSQGVGDTQQKRKFMPSLLYNTGRVISYTVIGGIVGGLGAVLTPSGQFKGIVAVGAGIFMVMMGLKMLNIFRLPPWFKLRIPGMSYRKIEASNPIKPLIIGLFNGFMPCGPLQTMQLYALGTGSIAKGALSMFFFSLGTVPLLFLFAAIASVISGRLSRGMMKVSAGLVIILGVIMLNRGLALSGFALDLSFLKGSLNEIPEIRMEDGKQVVNLVVDASGYTPNIPIVQVGVPVKMILDVGNINGCNNPIVIPEYGVEIDLKSSEPVVEFTPTKEGIIRISCWMGMITTKLTAVADPANLDAQDLENEEESVFGSNGFFEGQYETAVEVENKAAVATIDGNIQTIEMDVAGYAYTPNILVIQKGLATRWIINGVELNGCNYVLSIPDAAFYRELEEGKNEIRFTPDKTGELLFTCGMNMLAGKIVIVDDLNNVDLQALEQSRIEIPGGGASCH